MRVIDSKYSTDGTKIVKTATGEEIPADEPLFLIRAKDRLAVTALEDYLDLCRSDNCTTWQLKAMEFIIEDFRRFCDQHPERMKQPGSTMGR